jgi:hypothetical protein
MFSPVIAESLPLFQMDVGIDEVRVNEHRVLNLYAMFHHPELFGFALVIEPWQMCPNDILDKATGDGELKPIVHILLAEESIEVIQEPFALHPSMQLFLQGSDVFVAEVIHVLDTLVGPAAVQTVKCIEIAELVGADGLPILQVFVQTCLSFEWDFVLR